MKKKILKIFRITLGIILIITGVIGLFLPILQGIAMITLGIMLAFPKKGKKIIKYCRDCYNKKFKRR